MELLYAIDAEWKLNEYSVNLKNSLRAPSQQRAFSSSSPSSIRTINSDKCSRASYRYLFE